MVTKPTETEWKHQKPCYISHCEVCVAEIKLAAEQGDEPIDRIVNQDVMYQNLGLSEANARILKKYLRNAIRAISRQHEQQLQLACIDAKLSEARKARVLHVIDSNTNTSYPAQVGFEVSLTKTIPYSEHIADLEAQKAHLTTKGGSNE